MTPSLTRIANLLAPSPAKSPFISQSESKAAQKCGLRWLGQWHMAYRPAGAEGPAARIGSMGHAIAAACNHDLNRLDDEMVERAIAKENAKRQWWDPARGEPEWLDGERQQAIVGVRRLLCGVTLGSPARLADGIPLVEHRLKVQWDHLINTGLDRSVADKLRALGRLGIEGQPDLVHLCLQAGRDATFVDDFKFRQKPDLGGTFGKPDTSRFPDPQGAFYEVLLRAAGVVRDESAVFRLVNAYAGPWLTADDFIDEDDACARNPEMRRRLTCNDSLPSADLKRLDAMVTPEAWGEAFRVLADRRYQRRLSDYNNRPAKSRAKPPVRVTDSENWDACRFLEYLRDRPLIQEQVCPLDHSACLEVVRDMLAAVLAQETLVAAGVVPGRSLDPHPRSDCMRQWGCDLARPCQSAIGSGNAAEVFRAHAEDGRLRLRVLDGQDVGDDPET